MTNRPSPELDAFEERPLADLKAVVGAQAAASPPTSRAGTRSRQQLLWCVPTAGAAAAEV